MSYQNDCNNLTQTYKRIDASLYRVTGVKDEVDVETYVVAKYVKNATIAVNALGVATSILGVYFSYDKVFISRNVLKALVKSQGHWVQVFFAYTTNDMGHVILASSITDAASILPQISTDTGSQFKSIESYCTKQAYLPAEYLP